MEIVARKAGRAPAYPHSTLTERALDLIFPPTCVGCRRVGRWICDGCWSELHWTLARRCHSCGRPWISDLCSACSGGSTPLDSLTAVVEFEGPSREAVHALKYYGQHAISAMLARLMASATTAFPIDRVAPVPLHPSRRRERGYDQSALLARGVARALDVPQAGDTLRRVRRTRQQATLDAAARRRNVAGAFEATEDLGGLHILLVDDVVTTGATMESAASALREAGADQVHALVFACAVPGAPPDDA